MWSVALFKKRFRHRCFPVSFMKLFSCEFCGIFQKTFYIENRRLNINCETEPDEIVSLFSSSWVLGFKGEQNLEPSLSILQNQPMLLYERKSLRVDRVNFLEGSFWKNLKCYGLLNPFHPSVAFHIKTNHLIFNANQMTGFYMKCNTDQTWVKETIRLQVLWK